MNSDDNSISFIYHVQYVARVWPLRIEELRSEAFANMIQHEFYFSIPANTQLSE